LDVAFLSVPPTIICATQTLNSKKNKKAIEKQKELAQTFSKTGVASALILSSKMSVNAEGSTI